MFGNTYGSFEALPPYPTTAEAEDPFEPSVPQQQQRQSQQTQQFSGSQPNQWFSTTRQQWQNHDERGSPNFLPSAPAPAPVTRHKKQQQQDELPSQIPKKRMRSELESDSDVRRDPQRKLPYPTASHRAVPDQSAHQKKARKRTSDKRHSKHARSSVDDSESDSESDTDEEEEEIDDPQSSDDDETASSSSSEDDNEDYHRKSGKGDKGHRKSSSKRRSDKLHRKLDKKLAESQRKRIQTKQTLKQRIKEKEKAKLEAENAKKKAKSWEAQRLALKHFFTRWVLLSFVGMSSIVLFAKWTHMKEADGISSFAWYVQIGCLLFLSPIVAVVLKAGQKLFGCGKWFLLSWINVVRGFVIMAVRLLMDIIS